MNAQEKITDSLNRLQDRIEALKLTIGVLETMREHNAIIAIPFNESYLTDETRLELFQSVISFMENNLYVEELIVKVKAINHSTVYEYKVMENGRLAEIPDEKAEEGYKYPMEDMWYKADNLFEVNNLEYITLEWKN
jgi:hypothetical protein